MKLNIPDGVKLWGTNIVPSQQNMIDGGGGGGADGQFGWTKQIQNWDWTGSIKPQIDYLVGNNVGCNVIRFSTQCQGVPKGLFTQAAFDACVIQVADYCKYLGVYLYYSPMRYDNASLLNLPYATVAAQVAGTCLTLQNNYSNIVGIDVLQEAYFAVNNGACTTAYLGQVITEMKRLGVTLPLTCSSVDTLTAAGGGATWLNGAAQYFDYLDCHFYYTAADDLFEYLLANNPGKDIVVGEFGYPQSQSADSRELNMKRVLSMANSGNPRVRGAMLWGSYDQDATPSNAWGAYDVNFVPRQERLRVLRRFTGGSLSLSKRPYGASQ